jgi:hypothetical protein
MMAKLRMCARSIGEGLNIHFSTYERSWLRESLFAGRLTSSSAVAV